MYSRLLALFLTAVFLGLMSPHVSPASAAEETTGDGYCGRRGCTALVNKDGTTRDAPRRATKPILCKWSNADAEVADAGGAMFNSRGEMIETPAGTSVDPPNKDGSPHGQWLKATCATKEDLRKLGLNGSNTALSDGSETEAYFYLMPSESPRALAQQALSSVEFPKPVPHFSPNNMAIVNSPTWLWVEGWGPQSATAAVDGVAATATVTPTRVTWDMGDGNTVVCNGPGTAYDMNKSPAEQRSDCTYTYKWPSVGKPNSSYLVTATVEWQANWTVTGAAGGGSLGAYPQVSEPTPLRVGEIQGFNIEPGGTP